MDRHDGPDPAVMPTVSLQFIHAVQHLYFFVAAPALFFPLGVVLLNSTILPRVFAYLALGLATGFELLGLIFLRSLTLPDPVTAFAGVQALWWLGAGVVLMFRDGRKSFGAESSETMISQLL